MVGIVALILLKVNYSVTINNTVKNNAVSTNYSPFDQLTIPYLRKNTYESKLGSLTKESENLSYTSYLTNYTSDGFKINALLTIPTGAVPKGGFP